jgi:hypothetical protein
LKEPPGLDDGGRAKSEEDVGNDGLEESLGILREEGEMGESRFSKGDTVLTWTKAEVVEVVVDNPQTQVPLSDEPSSGADFPNSA